MKDVISVLQSRIAKRSRVISSRTTSRWVLKFGEKVLKAPMYIPNHPKIVALANAQKQDKRVLAEIIQLRREAKEYRCVKATQMVLGGRIGYEKQRNLRAALIEAGWWG